MDAEAGALDEFAPAKVNLFLRVRGRRADGYHDIESLVTFARLGDRLTLAPDKPLALTLRGPMARAAGPVADNLVLRAARELAARVPGLRTGAFTLHKRLPVAAGLGGGSSDAAAALRLLRRLNGLDPDDERLATTARGLGADVPVCLDPQPRFMQGAGERLSAPLRLPSLPALLVNPMVGVPTKDVFAAFVRDAVPALLTDAEAAFAADPPATRERLIQWLAGEANDLAAPAIACAPVIADVLARMRATSEVRLVRMSGSGATVFAVYDSLRAARSAGAALCANKPAWWIRATWLG